MCILNVACLDIGLPRMRTLGHGDVVVGQQGSLGFLESDDRDIVGRLELGFGRHGGGILADGVEEAVDRDPAFLVIGTLGFEPLGGGGPEPRRGLELLVVGVHFQEEPGQRVGRLVDDLLEISTCRNKIYCACRVLASGDLMPSGIWNVKPSCQVTKSL